MEPFDAHVQIVVGKPLATHVDAGVEGHVEQVSVAEVVAVELVPLSRRVETFGFRAKGRAVERYAVERTGEAAVDELGSLGVTAVDAGVIEGAALETRLSEERAPEIGAVEGAVAEDAARQRDEQRSQPAIELYPTEVAAIEEATAERELVEASAAEIDGGEGGAMQRDDAFVVGPPTFAVRLGHCAPV
ncbi:MAG TPA: hypothetical protein VGK07_05485 [Candidatus Limnocylindria bacterium]